MMKRSERTSQQHFTRSKWVSVTFIFMVAAAVASPTLLWPRRVEAAITLDPDNPACFKTARPFCMPTRGTASQTSGHNPLTVGRPGS